MSKFLFCTMGFLIGYFGAIQVEKMVKREVEIQVAKYLLKLKVFDEEKNELEK